MTIVAQGLGRRPTGGGVVQNVSIALESRANVAQLALQSRDAVLQPRDQAAATPSQNGLTVTNSDTNVTPGNTSYQASLTPGYVVTRSC